MKSEYTKSTRIIPQQKTSMSMSRRPEWHIVWILFCVIIPIGTAFLSASSSTDVSGLQWAGFFVMLLLGPGLVLASGILFELIFKKYAQKYTVSLMLYTISSILVSVLAALQW